MVRFPADEVSLNGGFLEDELLVKVSQKHEDLKRNAISQFSKAVTWDENRVYERLLQVRSSAACIYHHD